VEKVGGRPVLAYEADLADADVLDEILRRHGIDAVMHFAGKKAVGESVDRPLEYYDVNVGGTVALLRAICRHRVRRLVFSSSCSIYGRVAGMPISEREPAAPTNPYARSKWISELILADACLRWPELDVIALRYFNPIGAHDSGLLGEAPKRAPDNIVPYLMCVAAGRLDHLRVYGDDYETPDGTCVRDYVHVMDIAAGHRMALEHMEGETGVQVFNLGSGIGTSVLELVREFEAASGKPVPYEIVGRRPGDVDELVADSSLAEEKWAWRASRGLGEMCRDAWNFQRVNPYGYQSSFLYTRHG